MKTRCLVVAFLSVIFSAAHAGWQPLWPEGAPGAADPPAVQESIAQGNRYTDTAEPAYWFYPADPAVRNGAAVVIFPGGGYRFLAMDHEGHAFARWLNARGVAAVVVKYRVSGDDAAGFQYPIPHLDARRAIRLTRQNADEWQIHPQKIGVMGASAGGHLASMALTMFNKKYDLEADEPNISPRPNFGILVYPVIGLDQDWGHGGSRRHLLGPENPDELAQELATHRRVSRSTPPCFIFHAADDRVVPVRNAIEFLTSCAEHRVPAVGHIVAQGGHGFGLAGRGDSAHWTELLERWLETEPWYRSK